MYGYLQRGDIEKAKEQLSYVSTIKKVYPDNFKVAYAFAAMPARFVLENRMWKEAAALKDPETVDWTKVPWQKAILHFTRAMGAVHTQDMDAAKRELQELHKLHTKLTGKKDAYQAGQVFIQLKAVEAWIAFREGKHDNALLLMQEAADMEDRTGKHPVTPGEVLPARELLGDLLMVMNRPADAFTAYEASLKGHQNRFNGLYGAARAAERSGNTEKASSYYTQLLSISVTSAKPRKEIAHATRYLKTNQTTASKN